MEIIRGAHNLRAHHHGCVATLGNFDGVHRGHQMILRHLIDKAREYAVPSLLITFEPTPREFFHGASAPARLTSLREKLHLLCRAGLERVLVIAFNERIANLSAEEVIHRFLVGPLGVRHVVVGDDARFGRDAQGDYRLLCTAGEHNGFSVSNFGTLVLDGERVSSSRVRECLSAGDLAAAERLMGHACFIIGHVVRGRRLGRNLGTPTANIRLRRMTSALRGVFAATVNRGGEVLQAVANLGYRPTVKGQGLLLEVHLLDFDGDLYGERLCVALRHKLRDEQQFDSLDALRTQLALDKQRARELLV